MSVALLAACGMAACSDPIPLPKLPPDPRVFIPPEPPPSKVDVAREGLQHALTGGLLRWRLNGPRSYRLIVSRQCVCDAAFRVASEVRGGVVQWSSGTGAGRTKPIQTVEHLFSEVERTILSGPVSVTFDSTFGRGSRPIRPANALMNGS